MIQVELSKIIIDEKRQDQVIVLKEMDGERHFPIVIGFLEASSIKMKLSEVEPPRPMTHDLIVGLLEGLDARFDKLVIDKVINNTFHSKIVLKKKDNSEVIVDSRPSDGIALAVRMGADIYVEEEVIETATLFNNP